MPFAATRTTSPAARGKQDQPQHKAKRSVLSFLVCDATRTLACESKRTTRTKPHPGHLEFQPAFRAIERETVLRRLRIVCAVVVIGIAVVANFLPRLEAQSSSAANQIAAPANAPIVVAGGISARALALGHVIAESSKRPDIYLTASDRPNRVLALAAAIRGMTATSAVSNLVAIGGTGETGSLGDGGAATAAQLNLKFDSLNERSGIAIAADGTMFIADTHNATIRRISSGSANDADVIRSVAGKWAPQQNVQLVEPMGLALDRAGNLYIADHGANAVIELHSATASPVGRLEVLAHFSQPASIAVSSDGSRIFVASPESSSVFSLNTQTRAISQILGASTDASLRASTCASAAAPAATASSSANAASNPCPAGLAVDGGANLFIADASGNRILRIDASTGKTTSAATGITTPGDIAFDANGNLFIAEQGRNRISEIQGLGVPVSGVTLTPPATIVPPDGVPCPAIAPPPGFASNTNFCAQPLAGSTPTSAFTLTNSTNADVTGITVGTIGLNPGDFINSSTSCTSTLAANSSCAINLAFAPTASGTRTAVLGVNFTGANTPLGAAVAGTGDDYQIALASGQLTEISVVAGDKGTFMLQVVPDNTFTGTVTFVCPGNLPPQTTCTFSPTSVTVTTPGTAVPFSVSFQTTSRTPTKNIVPLGPGANSPAGASAFMRTREMNGGKVIFPALAVAFSILTMILLSMVAPRRSSRLLGFVSVCALALIVAAIVQGCGGGGSAGTTGTPAGSTKLIVQGATQNASRGITVTLDVE